MNLPANTNLPFFAYGIFKQGQISYPIIEPFVGQNTPHYIHGKLWVRDGIPLAQLLHHTDNSEFISGDLISFKRGQEVDGYQSICNLEPDYYYEWSEVAEGDNWVNILIGKKINKGAEEYEAPEWNSWDDPLFTTAFEVINELISEAENDLYSSIDGRSFLKLQMGYLLLWTSIERFVTLRYCFSGKTIRQKILELQYEPKFSEALLRLNSESYRKIYSSENTSDYFFDKSKPVKTLDYYYQIRSNITHRGKASVTDAKLVLKCLKDLTSVFEGLIISLKLNN
jgi:hypothetical protein